MLNEIFDLYYNLIVLFLLQADQLKNAVRVSKKINADQKINSYNLLNFPAVISQAGRNVVALEQSPV